MNDESEKILVIDGVEPLGVVERCGEPPFVVYRYEDLLSHFMGQGMEYSEAAEWISFNITGTWLGPHTIGVIMPLPPLVTEPEVNMTGTDADGSTT